MTVKRRGPIPIGDLTEPVEHDGTPGRTDVGALVDPGILELDERRRVFVPWDEIDLRVPLAHRGCCVSEDLACDRLPTMQPEFGIPSPVTPKAI